jgi:hypothetical protein
MAGGWWRHLVITINGDLTEEGLFVWLTVRENGHGSYRVWQLFFIGVPVFLPRSLIGTSHPTLSTALAWQV